MNGYHYLSAVISSTKPPKHMRARDSLGRTMSTEEIKGLPKWLDLARLEEACKPYKADPLKVLAYALSDEAREKAEVTGMTLKEQASISVKLFDKANPSQQAIKHSGDKKEPVRLIIEG